PATALVIRADGPQVVTVTEDQKAHFQKVVIGRDYGNELDISSGIEPGATLIVNVTDALHDGAPVCARQSATVDQMSKPEQGPHPQKGKGRKKSGSKQDGKTVKSRRAFSGDVRRGAGAKPDHKTANPGSGFK